MVMALIPLSILGLNLSKVIMIGPADGTDKVNPGMSTLAEAPRSCTVRAHAVPALEQLITTWEMVHVEPNTVVVALVVIWICFCC